MRELGTTLYRHGTIHVTLPKWPISSLNLCRLGKKMGRACGLQAVGRCQVSRQDSSVKHHINTMVDLVMSQSLPMLQTINNGPSLQRPETPRGHFHIFLAELFPAILRNIYYCKPNEKTWHLFVIRGPVAGGVLRWASVGKLSDIHTPCNSV